MADVKLVLDFQTMDDLCQQWLDASGIPFQPVHVIATPHRLIVRVAADDVLAAEGYLATRRVRVGGRVIGIKLAVAGGGAPDADPAVAALREQLVGCTVEGARERVQPKWRVLREIGTDATVTADHVPGRLNLVVSDERLVVDVFLG